MGSHRETRNERRGRIDEPIFNRCMDRGADARPRRTAVSGSQSCGSVRLSRRDEGRGGGCGCVRGPRGSKGSRVARQAIVIAITGNSTEDDARNSCREAS